MNPNQPEFIYIALILPSLFALTLIAEGVNKILRQEPGWVSLTLGSLFIALIVGVYFFVLQ